MYQNSIKNYEPIHIGNDWGFYIDIDNNNNKVLKNISLYNNNNNNFCSKYSTIISISLFTIIIIIFI